MDVITLAAAIRLAKKGGGGGSSGAPIEVSGATPTITAEAGRAYVCTAQAVTDLSFTPSATGVCEVIFTCGTTPTTLDTTKLTGVLWPGWFDPAHLDASTTYELSILNGKLGAVGVWT